MVLYGAVEVAVLRLVLEVVQHQALKDRALAADGRAFGAETGEELLQGAWDARSVCQMRDFTEQVR